MNQLEWERRLFATLRVSGPESRLLDIGCGRGRIAHHLATLSGGKVSGFNIDAYQVGNAREYAAAEGMSGRLDFKQGDHHKRFQYEDASFSGAYSVQAIWPFFKVHELDSVARELFRVLKPGARYSCSEYLLTPHFDWNNAEHVELHRLFLPTLAATQSNYPADVTDALQRAGFSLITSMPSARPSWPLTDQKTDLYILMRSVVQVLTAIGLSPAWLDTLMTQLLLGGQAWAEAEKMKIADLNWEIVVEKPLS
jgi:sterol 24-C-methyltransferase